MKDCHYYWVLGTLQRLFVQGGINSLYMAKNLDSGDHKGLPYREKILKLTVGANPCGRTF